MTKTWKPTTAGILSIIAGVIQVIGGLVVTVIGGAVGALAPQWWAGGALASVPGMGGIMAAIGIPLIIIGIVAIVGGVYALKRRIWGLALAGAICAVIGPWGILGVLAIIFVAMGKGEFEQKTG